VRGAELTWALSERRVHATLVVPFERPHDDLLNIRVRRLPRVESEADAREAARALLDDHRPDLLVVDSFPSGPAGELRGLSLPPSILLARLHRDANEAGYARDASVFERVLDLEPHLDWLPLPAEPFGPVARAPRPGADAPEVDALFVASEPELEGLFLRVAPSLGGRVCVARAAGLSTDGSDAYPWLLDRVRPRVIVGPAGFNLTYEARAAGLTHLAVPRPRRFDDQARRAEAVATRVRSPRHLLRLLQDPPAPAPIRVRSHDDLADVVLEAWRVRPPTPLSLRP